MNGDDRKLFADLGEKMGKLIEGQENQEQLLEKQDEKLDAIQEELSKKATKVDIKTAMKLHLIQEHDAARTIGKFIINNKALVIWAVIVTAMSLMALFGIPVEAPTLP